MKAFRRYTESLGRLADECAKIIECVQPPSDCTLKDIVSREIATIHRTVGIQDQLDTGATSLAMMYLDYHPQRPYLVFERLALLNNMIRGCEAASDPHARFSELYTLLHAETHTLMHTLLAYKRELHDSFPLVQP